MADDIRLPEITTAESIPPALAAPRRRRKVAEPVVRPDPVPAPAEATASVPDPAPAQDTPPAAAPAAHQEKIMATTIEDVTAAQQQGAETVKDQAQAFMADAKSRTEDAVAKGQRFWADFADFSRGNVEALVESGRVAAKGFEQMGREAAENARKSFEATSSAVKTMAQVKSPTEFVRLQGDYARTAFDNVVAEASRSTEAMLKLAGEIAQPLSNRAAVAADKMKIGQ